MARLAAPLLVGIIAGTGCGPGELEQALRAGDVDRVESLVARGADVDARTLDRDFERFLMGLELTHREPLLHLAARAGADATRVLLEAGARVDARCDPHGWTALSVACWQGTHDTVALLLDHRAGAGVAGSDGWTPLMLAALHDSRSVRALLAADAPAGARDRGGLTAFEWGASLGRVPAALALFDATAELRDADTVFRSALARIARRGRHIAPRATLTRACEQWLADRVGRPPPAIVRAATEPGPRSASPSGSRRAATPTNATRATGPRCTGPLGTGAPTRRCAPCSTRAPTRTRWARRAGHR